VTFQFKLKGHGAIAALAMTVLASGCGAASAAEEVKRIPLTASQNPSGADAPVSQAVWAGDTLYISGWLDPDLKTHTDTKSQAAGIFKDVEKFLESQNLTLGDVVMMRVYLGRDPAKGGKIDLAGSRAAYPLFFGTKDQPNKPACTAVFAALPSGPRGALVEIDFIAVRSK
jgi:enamine deaminase RidA (YjgF/YER057c/UK114 family)